MASCGCLPALTVSLRNKIRPFSDLVNLVILVKLVKMRNLVSTASSHSLVNGAPSEV